MTETMFKYGFRYDPMEWGENDDSFNAAIARKEVFRIPKPGDDEVIRKHIDDGLPEAITRAEKRDNPDWSRFFASPTGEAEIAKGEGFHV